MKFDKKTLLVVCMWLVLVGALNWLAVAVSPGDEDLVKPLLGLAMVKGGDNHKKLANSVYGLVGLAGVVLLMDKAELL